MRSSYISATRSWSYERDVSVSQIGRTAGEHVKHVLVIAKFDQAEAMRVAAGLTLLDDSVRICVVGAIEKTAAVAEQKEVLDFVEVPCDTMDAGAPFPSIARAILNADAVYLL